MGHTKQQATHVTVNQLIMQSKKVGQSFIGVEVKVLL